MIGLPAGPASHVMGPRGLEEGAGKVVERERRRERLHTGPHGLPLGVAAGLCPAGAQVSGPREMADEGQFWGREREHKYSFSGGEVGGEWAVPHQKCREGWGWLWELRLGRWSQGPSGGVCTCCRGGREPVEEGRHGSDWTRGSIRWPSPGQPLCCFLTVCGFVPEATWMLSQPWPPASLWPSSAMSLLSLAKRPGLGRPGEISGGLEWPVGLRGSDHSGGPFGPQEIVGDGALPWL